MNKKVALVGGVGLGAALMYLFDPDRGRRRRSLIRDKAEAAANKAGDYAEKMSHDLQNRAYGMVAEAKSIFRNEEVTDEVLVDRVRARLGHFSTQASGVNVTAQNGTVTLGGSISSQEVADILGAVRSVRGVRNIDNQFDLHAADESEPSVAGVAEAEA